MESSSKRRLILSALVSVIVIWPSCCACLVPHLAQPYSNPPAGLQGSDLVGTWETHYMEAGADRLVLRSDGTFRQTYQDWIVEGYAYETPWNEWRLERCGDGRMRLHLQGARYYPAGISIAEREGMNLPGPLEALPFDFYDPVAENFLHMVGELVLNVRCDSSGELVLLHMWTDIDRGVALIGGSGEEFRRAENP